MLMSEFTAHQRDNYLAFVEYANVKNGKKVLIIGERNPKKLDGLLDKYDVTIIEAFWPNVQLMSNKTNCNVVHADIQNYTTIDLDFASFDCVVWLHGPEHLEKDISLDVIRFLVENINTVILSMPHGYYPQGALYNNPFEIHQSEWTVEDFYEFNPYLVVHSEKAGDMGSLDVYIQKH